MSVYVLALLIGVVAGLRAMIAPTAVSWAARLGWLPLQGTPLAFFGFAATPYIFTVLAVVELITDQLPETPSRKVPLQFGARIVLGALSGAAISGAHGGLAGGAIVGVLGAVLGAVGAIIGTLGGAKARGALARMFGRDAPAALIEDVVAIVVAVLLVVSLHGL
ncbi:DUF4126 domain-containing protein [Paraburkholderia sp. Ac-20336]|uniref:DUF4126 domain-containing protein n=1 Tax=Burkholderiaceae TaxID=119060 RepID=UPI0014238A75|nr:MULTISPECIES: DUF4126 domain-containing protein [Burkholderiaceae]MBN3803995.1 DUF4126 domain-containing protein [Paraburkholderia sp. Ac-20336]MBN3847609.1 DUF4126 domain-containing protein [Paraburkholderia sp. Ac-20342]NIF53352.1 DUF4126 domain-containing protein [Burkholderia sp. Ax-1724]NIF78727.1 DUF4126 domain-containing protein [Paraburkholderia sp. Cy-641]